MFVLNKHALLLFFFTICKTNDSIIDIRYTYRVLALTFVEFCRFVLWNGFLVLLSVVTLLFHSVGSYVAYKSHRWIIVLCINSTSCLLIYVGNRCYIYTCATLRLLLLEESVDRLVGYPDYLSDFLPGNIYFSFFKVLGVVYGVSVAVSAGSVLGLDH